MEQVFRTIDDNQVRHVWKCTAEQCEAHNPLAIIPPTFYQENGEPLCECGEIMEYQGTQVAIPIIKVEVTGGVADVTECPECVEIEIVDHDNEGCGEE
jgi:hypothetical protein